MKKIIFLMIILILNINLFANPSSSEYIIVNIDESDPNQKIYGLQLENSTKWQGIEVTTHTIHYNKGTSTTTYSQWWDVRKSTATIYRDAFEYQKHNYPN